MIKETNHNDYHLRLLRHSLKSCLRWFVRYLHRPASIACQSTLKSFFRKHEGRERWLGETKITIPYNRYTAQHFVGSPHTRPT